MKGIKNIILLFLALFSIGSSYAAELTQEQRRFRSSVQQFLKEEGFFATIDDDDNSLNFKKEGTLYWISFGGSSPIYLEVHRAGLDCEDADRTSALKAVNAANRKVRCVKAMLNDSSISFAIEMYCHSPEEFRYIFYKCITELENAKREVVDYYNGLTASILTGDADEMHDYVYLTGSSVGASDGINSDSVEYDMLLTDLKQPFHD